MFQKHILVNDACIEHLFKEKQEESMLIMQRKYGSGRVSSRKQHKNSMQTQELHLKMEQCGHFFEHPPCQHVHGCILHVFIIMKGVMLCQEVGME